MIQQSTFSIGDNVQIIDPEENNFEWATFTIVDFDSDYYLLSGIDKSTYEPLSGFALEGRSLRADGRRFDLTSSFSLVGLRPPPKSSIWRSSIAGGSESPCNYSFCPLPSALCLRSRVTSYEICPITLNLEE